MNLWMQNGAWAERRTVLIDGLRTLRPDLGVLARDVDAEPDAASIRCWSGRQSLGEMSVCYPDAWESMHPGDPGHTFTPSNPPADDSDWPVRPIDYIFVRCGEHGGPALRIV